MVLSAGALASSLLAVVLSGLLGARWPSSLLAVVLSGGASALLPAGNLVLSRVWERLRPHRHALSQSQAGEEFNAQMFIIRTTLISVPTRAKMQRLEVVRGRSEFLTHFSTPQANPTQLAHRPGPQPAAPGGNSQY